MGWASGSDLFSSVIYAVKPRITEEAKRKDLYKELIAAFEGADWDTQDECMGEDPAYDRALEELHPEWFVENKE